MDLKRWSRTGRSMDHSITRAERTGMHRTHNRRVRWPALLAGLTLAATLSTGPSSAAPPEKDPKPPKPGTITTVPSAQGTPTTQGAPPAPRDLQFPAADSRPAAPATLEGGSAEAADLNLTGAGTRAEPEVLCGIANSEPPECLWISRYAPPDGEAWVRGGGGDNLGLSPDGATVYIAAMEWGDPDRWAVIAYDAATGEQQWIARDRPDVPADLVVSPDGATVYVTGAFCASAECHRHLQTVAFDAATGEERWVAIYEPATPAWDNFLTFGEMKISPDGSTVYITTFARGGRPCGDSSCQDRITIAYDAATGEERWVKLFSHYNSMDFGHDLDIHPDSSAVYVTGESRGWDENGRRIGDYTTVAYDAATGEELWVAVLEELEGCCINQQGGETRVSPDGSTVYVTGISDASGLPLPPACGYRSLDEYSTAAYDAATGEELWLARFHGEGSCRNQPGGLTVSPDNATVYVTGLIGTLCGEPVVGNLIPCGSTFRNQDDFGTVAYDAATGEELWVAVFAEGLRGTAQVGNWPPSDLELSPDGSTLYIAGRSGGFSPPFQYDYATIAYDTATGQQQWAVRFDGPGGPPQGDMPQALELSPDGAILYVTGESANVQGREALTIAYRVGDGADPDPSPTPSPTPTPTGSPTPTPTPSESPAPDTTEVSFTERSRTSGQYSDETLFEARLTDSGGDPIAHAELAFELTGAESSRTFTATTDSDGFASVTPTLDEKPGAYQLTVRYAGDDDRAPSADTTSFVVEKEDSALDLSEEKGKDKALVAHLYDLDTPADGIAGRTIDFYEGDELIGSATTDEDGIATFEPPKQKGKPQPYEARFEGDDFYLASSAQADKGGKGGNGGGG